MLRMICSFADLGSVISTEDEVRGRYHTAQILKTTWRRIITIVDPVNEIK